MMQMHWDGWPKCPCGCGAEALKLVAPLKRNGERHVLGCQCRSHISLRNRHKGRAAQTTMHRALGGTGVSPTHEESGRGYDITVQGTEGGADDTDGQTTSMKVWPESKQGAQVPAALTKFLATDWYRRALSQSVRSLPVGLDAKPAVWCQLPGGRKVLVVDYGGSRHG